MSARRMTLVADRAPRGGGVLSDEKLRSWLVRAATGDPGAFMLFYDATCDLVWQLELSRSSSRPGAERAAARRYRAAWLRVDEQAGSGLSARAWLLSLECPEICPEERRPAS